MKTPTRSLLGACVLCWLALAAVGCTHVKPYEREYLAHPGMDLSREHLAGEFESHVHDAREGAMGSSSDSTGGGCGCN